MSEVASLDDAREKRAVVDKARADRERAECLTALRRKVGRLVATGVAPNSIAAACFLVTAEIAITGGMSDADVSDAVRESIAFVRLQLGAAQPAPLAPAPTPEPSGA